jgi:hypothetical protein
MGRVKESKFWILHSICVLFQSLFLITVLIIRCSAQENPYHPSTSFSQKNLREIRDGKSYSFKLMTRLPGLGRVKLIAKNVDKGTWPKKMSTKGLIVEDPTEIYTATGILEKAIKNGSKTIPWGGAVSFHRTKDNTWRYELKLHLRSLKYGRFYTIQINEQTSKNLNAKLKTVPRFFLKDKKCATHSVHHQNYQITDSVKSSYIKLPPPSLKASVNKEIELSTDADVYYFQRFGNSTNSTIASIVAVASSIYEMQFGMRIKIVSQHVHTSSATTPTTSTDPEIMLGNFATVGRSSSYLGQADIYHLFSGINMDGSTVGIAYMGVVCNFPRFSYGITQSFNESFDGIILAHELAHNLNAQHDSTDSSGIMYPALQNPVPNKFSTTSVSQISNFINSVNCISPLVVNTPTPVPTQAKTSTPISTTAPQITPTTTSGGGSGGTGSGGAGTGGSSNQFIFDAQVRKTGIVSLGFSVSNFSSACSYSIVAQVPSKSYEEIIAQSTLTENNISFFGKSKFTAKGKVNFFAKTTCSGIETSSNIVSLRMRGTGRTVSYTKWLQQVKKSLRVNKN